MDNEINKYAKSGEGKLSITYDNIEFNGKDMEGKTFLSMPFRKSVAIIQKRKKALTLP